MKTAPQEAGIRIITGRVNTDGTTPYNGGDFYAVRTSTGGYSVRWLIPVKSVLGITISPQTGNANLAVVSGLIDGGVTGFAVITYTNAAAGVDCAFSFSARVVPR